MPIQAVTLLFTNRPDLDFSTIARRAEEIRGEELDYPERGDRQKLFIVRHKHHPVRYNDGICPAQTVFTVSEQKTAIENYRSIVEQSWSCKNAADLIQSARYSVMMTEMMADGLNPQLRLSLFHDTLQAAIEIAKPQALIFHHTQQVVAPDDYLDCCALAPIMRAGAVNIRFFNIANADGEMLMDTRGMEEIGLHDLQCHFYHLDPNNVSRVLYNTAFYIAEHGAVIESGHTIAGIDPSSSWTCQFEEALVEPKRVLLDLNPGLEFAAGRSN